MLSKGMIPADLNSLSGACFGSESLGSDSEFDAPSIMVVVSGCVVSVYRKENLVAEKKIWSPKRKTRPLLYSDLAVL